MTTHRLQTITNKINFKALAKGPIEIITHASCPDGMASAMILWDAICCSPIADQGVTVTFTKHGDKHLRMPRGGCIFVDIAPPEEYADEWLVEGAIVLDHHKKQEEIVQLFVDRDQGVFADETQDPGISGAMLAYFAAIAIGGGCHKIRIFAEVAGIRDTWQRDSPLWHRACGQASALMFFDWDTLRHYPYLLPSQQDMGDLLHMRRLSEAKAIAAKLVITQHYARAKAPHLDVDPMILINGQTHLASDIAETLRVMVAPACMFAAWELTTDNKVYCTMRSLHDDFSVGNVASAMGGGGHTKAAGFRVPFRAWDELAGTILEIQTHAIKEGLRAGIYNHSSLEDMGGQTLEVTVETEGKS